MGEFSFHLCLFLKILESGLGLTVVWVDIQRVNQARRMSKLCTRAGVGLTVDMEDMVKLSFPARRINAFRF